MSLVNRGIKSTPMCTVKYTAVVFYVVGLSDCDSVRNIIMSHVWIFQRTIIQKQTSKNNRFLHKASAMAIPVL